MQKPEGQHATPDLVPWLDSIALCSSGLLYIKGINQDLNPNKVLGPEEPPPTLPQETKAEVDAVSADLHNNIAGTWVGSCVDVWQSMWRGSSSTYLGLWQIRVIPELLKIRK